MHDFRVSIRLGMMIFMVSRMKQNIWKDFISMKQDMESFGLRLKISYGKVKDEMRLDDVI